ncbi:IPT/TIG domain-containing protein [uncultured Bacteroides sp.]|uniref:IPT/TIG domain-containing protein n=1 Tax=uncultured Bacteroides sp. TaxID=162156 RepID=UPI0025D4E10B|nr:IPT/TIG domain-containing protein [uncultured Bacteroides sp.]
MQTMKHLTYIFLLALTVLAAGCSDNEFEFSENYDIPWKISTITAVSPLTAAPGTHITIQGENLDSDLVSSTGITIGTEICTIVSQSATSITVVVPSFQTSEELDVAVQNLHNRKFTFGQKFTPILN